MLAQRRPDGVQRTTQTLFTSKKWPCPNIVQPTKYKHVCPTLVLRCKANTIKGPLSKFHLAHDGVGPMLAPTLCTQRQPSANGTTVCQRWLNVVMLSGYISFFLIIQIKTDVKKIMPPAKSEIFLNFIFHLTYHIIICL